MLSQPLRHISGVHIYCAPFHCVWRDRFVFFRLYVYKHCASQPIQYYIIILVSSAAAVPERAESILRYFTLAVWEENKSLHFAENQSQTVGIARYSFSLFGG